MKQDYEPGPEEDQKKDGVFNVHAPRQIGRKRTVTEVIDLTELAYNQVNWEEASKVWDDVFTQWPLDRLRLKSSRSYGFGTVIGAI